MSLLYKLTPILSACCATPVTLSFFSSISFIFTSKRSSSIWFLSTRAFLRPGSIPFLPITFRISAAIPLVNKKLCEHETHRGYLQCFPVRQIPSTNYVDNVLVGKRFRFHQKTSSLGTHRNFYIFATSCKTYCTTMRTLPLLLKVIFDEITCQSTLFFFWFLNNTANCILPKCT